MKCTDPQFGRLLHEYELALLSESESDAFEQHLLKCDFCFEELKVLSGAAKHLREDPVVRQRLREVDEALVESSQRSGIWQLIWPDTHILLKPAIAYAAIVLLVPLALLWNRQQTVAPWSAKTIELGGVYRGHIPEIALSPGESLVMKQYLDSETYAWLSSGVGKVEIVAPDSRRVATLASPRIDADSALTFVLQPSVLKTGKYEVRLYDRESILRSKRYFMLTIQ